MSWCFLASGTGEQLARIRSDFRSSSLRRHAIAWHGPPLALSVVAQAGMCLLQPILTELISVLNGAGQRPRAILFPFRTTYRSGCRGPP